MTEYNLTVDEAQVMLAAGADTAYRFIAARPELLKELQAERIGFNVRLLVNMTGLPRERVQAAADKLVSQDLGVLLDDEDTPR
jgi:2-methylisocitrate lyase-like PEP mutase family enzyme